MMNVKEVLCLLGAGFGFFGFSVLAGNFANLIIAAYPDNMLGMSVVVMVGLAVYGAIGVKSFKLFLKVHDARLFEEWNEECM